MAKIKARAQLRQVALKRRAAKMQAARFCYNMASLYHEGDNLPGTMYWEGEYRRCTNEAGSISRLEAV